MKMNSVLILIAPSLLLILTLIALRSPVLAADEQKAVTTLSVVNEAGKSTTVSPDDFAKLPRKTVRTKDHSGTIVTYEGVSLADVLTQAGVALGKELKGPRLANCLLVEAADGYRVVLALPEIDPAMTNNIVLLADRREGQHLDVKHGPFQLVVPQDKRQSRWVRQVVKMSVVQVGEPGKQK